MNASDPQERSSSKAPQDEWLLRLLALSGGLQPSQAEEVRRSGAAFASSEIVKRGFMTREGLARAVWERYRIPSSDADAQAVDRLTLTMLPERICRRYAMAPLRLDGERLSLLMANPLDASALEAAAAASGRRPIPIFGFPDVVQGLLAALADPDQAVSGLLDKLPEADGVEWLGGEGEALEGAASEEIHAPVIRLADGLIAQAVKLGASDLHIEQSEADTQVRCRIDGDLRLQMTLPKSVGGGPLVTRIKIMANLDPADRRRPQDGRAKLRVGGREIGLRVSTLPTSFGEKVVLRLLDDSKARVELGRLGFRPELLARMERLLGAKEGIVLATGPTGAGKTTTLYSMLHRLQAPDVNIVTVEDPVEYRLPGVNQVQVNEKAGVTFASSLRSILRQDPDIILVGEIRDQETASIAFQAALTGHLVLSTLHTNDALASIHRLIDMGVERFKVTPALKGVVSQRLARRLCVRCRTRARPEPRLQARLREAGLEAVCWRANGCEACGFSGFKGRLTLAEVLELGQEARDALATSKDDAVFRREALERGWLSTMAEDALWHLAQGDLSVDEAMGYIDEPAAPARGRSGASGSERRPPLPDAPREGAKEVLVVDDSLDNRALARDVLESAGYKVREAADGAAGLKEIARAKPDLVLLDLMMPGLDGFEFVSQLRGSVGEPTLPVLVLSAMGEAQAQESALELGADDFMTKPFIPKILLARVNALFRRAELAAAR